MSKAYNMNLLLSLPKIPSHENKSFDLRSDKIQTKLFKFKYPADTLLPGTNFVWGGYGVCRKLEVDFGKDLSFHLRLPIDEGYNLFLVDHKQSINCGIAKTRKIIRNYFALMYTQFFLIICKNYLLL